MMKLPVASRPLSSIKTTARLALLVLVLALIAPHRAGVGADSVPDKINLVTGNPPSDWKNMVPGSDELARAARLSALMYQVDSQHSISWTYTNDTLIPTAFLRNQQGVEAAVVVCPTDETIHIVFRGTDGSTVDVGIDLQFRSIPYSDGSDGRTFVNGNVHEGFKLSLEDRQLLTRLDNAVLDALADYPTYRVEVNGHSLGGAQAELYGVHLATTTMPPGRISVLTIGCPRIGDSDFKEAVNAIPNLAIWRMVNRDDLIPRVPLNVMDYHHVGHLIWFTRQGTAEVYYQQTGLQNVYEGVDDADWQVDLVTNPLSPIFNHLPWEYEMIIGQVVMSSARPLGFEASDGEEDTCCLWIAICLRYCQD